MYESLKGWPASRPPFGRCVLVTCPIKPNGCQADDWTTRCSGSAIATNLRANTLSLHGSKAQHLQSSKRLLTTLAMNWSDTIVVPSHRSGDRDGHCLCSLRSRSCNRSIVLRVSPRSTSALVPPSIIFVRVTKDFHTPHEGSRGV